MIALGWRPPADVPTAINDCMVSDSSGISLTFSRSTNILWAKSVNAFIFSFSDFLMPEDSGINSKAPIPRLPINDRISSGVIS